MAQSRWRWIALGVQLAIVLVVLAFIGRTVVALWPQIARLDWRLSPGLLVGALLAGIASQAFLVIGWRLALRLVGAEVSWEGAMTSQLIGQLAKYVPGKVLTLVGKGYLAARAGASDSQAVVAMFVEAAAQLTTALAVGSAYILTAQTADRAVVPVAAAVVVLSIAVLHPAIMPRAVGAALSAMKRKPVALQYQLRSVLPLAACYLAMWAVIGAGVWLLSQGVGLHVPVVPIIAGYCVSWAAGFLSFIFPGGLGVREIAYAHLLGPSATASAAMSIALVSRVWLLLLELGGALFVWAYRGLRRAAAVEAPAESSEMT